MTDTQPATGATTTPTETVTTTQPAVTTPATGNPTTTGVTPPAPAPQTVDTAAEIRDLKGRVESGDARIRELNNENKKYRLLSETLASLNLKPEEIGDALRKGSEAQSSLSQIEKRKQFDKAMSAAGYDAEAVSQLSGALDAEYSVKPETKDGKTTDAGFVKFKDDKGNEVEKPVSEFVALKWPKMAELVKATPAQPTTQWVQQSSGVEPNAMSEPGPRPAKYRI